MNDTGDQDDNLDPRVFTVTVNTAIDSTLHIENFELGYDNHIIESHGYAAGKGINVARALASCAIPVSAMGFTGRDSIQLFENLELDGLSVDLIPVAGACRNNYTLIDTVTGRQSHLRAQGYQVTADDCQKLFNFLEARIKPGDIIVVTGSLPLGANPHYYHQLIAGCQQKACRVFFDSSGDALKAGLKAKPYLIKPNLIEFEQLHSRSFKQLTDMIDAATKLLDAGVERICVSRAELGLVYIDPDGVYIADCNTDNLGSQQSHVGCGDSLLAGLVIGELLKMPLIEAIKLAVACGVANMYTAQPGLLNPDLVNKLIERVKVHRYN